MNVFGLDMPDILIKVCEKEEYAKDVKYGNLYMKESGYFRKIENNYRGDRNDGKMPFRASVDIIKETTDGRIERFSEVFPDLIIKDEIIAGVEGDDKYPIFCATIFNENILESGRKKGKYNIFKFKSSYINEMRRFGEYVVAFNGQELLSKINDKVTAKEYQRIISGTVKYWDINKLYSFKNLSYFSQQQIQFFNKDITYKKQNEFRILIPDSNLIDKDKDYYIMSVGQLTSAHICSIDDLDKFIIKSDS